VLPKAVDSVGGAVVGLMNAYFLTGFLMVGFALFPGTGDAKDKVIFLGADVFFARVMEGMSRRAGSAEFNARKFLEDVRKEKYLNSARERGEVEKAEENRKCFHNLERLGRALQEYVVENDGLYPRSIRDLKGYLPKRLKDKAREATLRCAATQLPYRLFQVNDYRSVEGDGRFVLIYEVKYWTAEGADLGHRGKGEGKRPTLFADGRVRWVSDGDLKALLKAQKKVMSEEEEE